MLSPCKILLHSLAPNCFLEVECLILFPPPLPCTPIDWTSQYCWTNGWNCLWWGHSVYRNRPLIPLHTNRPCNSKRGGGCHGGGVSLSVLQMYTEGRILGFSRAFAGRTRWPYWCSAVCLRSVASKALHCTLDHADHFSVSQLQPRMLIILARGFIGR